MSYSESIALNIPTTEKPRVIIIGGGFGGLAVIKNLRRKGFQVVVFDKHNYNTFHPLLYQVATAGLQPDSIASPIRKELWAENDYHYRMLTVQSVDTDAKKVETYAGSLSYDYLIIATGSKPNFFGNEQIQKNVLPLKTIPDALNMRSHILQMMEWANICSSEEQQDEFMNIVIVGAGPTGVEMAGALAELRRHILPKDYPQLDLRKMNIYLLEGGHRILPAMSDVAGWEAMEALDEMDIIVKLNCMVASYDGRTVVMKNGSVINSRTVIWSAGIKGKYPAGIPAKWVEGGKIAVDEYCRVKECPNIFAIGDIALLKTNAYPNGLPSVAQPAMQMGAYVGKNLRKLHESRKVKPFHYFDKGSMATIGRNKAVADFPGNVSFSGRIAWFLWLFIHISYLVSFRNKLVVLATWCWSFLTYEKGNRLIIRPFLRKSDTLSHKFIEKEELV